MRNLIFLAILVLSTFLLAGYVNAQGNCGDPGKTQWEPPSTVTFVTKDQTSGVVLYSRTIVLEDKSLEQAREEYIEKTSEAGARGRIEATLNSPILDDWGNVVGSLSSPLSCQNCAGGGGGGGTISTQPSNVVPTADAGGPYTAALGEEITFDGSGSSDPDGSITSYSWNFGDGSTGSGVRPTHSYDTINAYSVTLTVTDNLWATANAATTVTITNMPPTLDIIVKKVASKIMVSKEKMMNEMS